jgi:hypothetical protein
LSPFFNDGYFWDRVSQTIFLGWFFFVCAYKAWVISTPCPHPLPYHPLCPLPLPTTPSIPGRNYFEEFFFFWLYWGLNSWPHICEAGTLPLIPSAPWAGFEPWSSWSFWVTRITGMSHRCPVGKTLLRTFAMWQCLTTSANLITYGAGARMNGRLMGERSIPHLQRCSWAFNLSPGKKSTCPQ